MKIGIDASRAFLKNRTGIEEYSYQTINHLRDELKSHQVVLYIRGNQPSSVISHQWPDCWRIKVIKFPRLWTQVGLSLEMLLHPVDALFVPAHTVPIIHPARNATRFFNNAIIWQIRKLFNSEKDWQYAHSVAGGPKKTIVVVHGLEYEFCPSAYSKLARFYMRLTIKKSCQWASKIISVSENTKKDLIELYNVPSEKIEVIYEGYDRERNFQFPISNFQTNLKEQISKPACHSERSEESRKIKGNEIDLGIFRFTQNDSLPYLLFIGRIEQRKNIENIAKAFEILKEKYQIPHKLILAGRPGHGYEIIKSQISNLKSQKDIIELGYVSEDEKWELLKKAEVFVFPTLYEGFGIPILEAQSVGTTVVAANNSSIPEVALESALLVDPKNPEEIAETINLLLSDKSAKNAIIAKGLENVKRFSWEKCAREIALMLQE